MSLFCIYIGNIKKIYINVGNMKIVHRLDRKTIILKIFSNISSAKNENGFVFI